MNYLFLILFVFLIFMSAIHVGIYGRFKFYGLDNRKSVKYAVSLPFYIIKIAFLLYRDAKKAKKKKAYLYLLFPIRKFWEVVTVFVMVRVKIEAEYEVAQELLSELREQTKKKNRLANIVKEDKLLKIDKKNNRVQYKPNAFENEMKEIFSNFNLIKSLLKGDTEAVLEVI